MTNGYSAINEQLCIIEPGSQPLSTFTLLVCFVASSPILFSATSVGMQAVREPMTFEENAGQSARAVRFVGRSNGCAVFLTDRDAVIGLRGASLRLSLRGANAGSTIEPLDLKPGRSNYFHGSDPRNWKTGIRRYGRVRYDRVYPGVDLVYYGDGDHLEYDFIVAPGASADRIEMEFAGARELTIDARGDLVLDTTAGAVVQRKPSTYQLDGERRIPVSGRYVRRGARRVAFELGAYDRSKELVIDPTVAFSTYLGGGLLDWASAIALDQMGNPGCCRRHAFYGLPNDSESDSGADTSIRRRIYITKFSADGSTMLFSTFLSGTFGGDQANAVTFDTQGNIYITGRTSDVDFPTTPGAYQLMAGDGMTGFVAKLSADGSQLLYSTYLSATAGQIQVTPSGIAVDDAGAAYVTGYTQTFSGNFPTTPGAFMAVQGDGVPYAFVTKLTPDGSALAYSTVLGGTAGAAHSFEGVFKSLRDGGGGIVVDANGEAIITGSTASTDFPTSNAFQSKSRLQAPNGSQVFITKFNPAGSSLIFSTYLGGGASSEGVSIALDGNGNIYAAGDTDYSNGGQTNVFPSMNPLYSGPDFLAGCCGGWLAEFDPNGHLLFSSEYGPSDFQAGSIALGPDGSIYVVGTSVNGWPAATIQPGQSPFFVFQVSPNYTPGYVNNFGPSLGGSSFLLNTLAACVAVDGSGDTFVTGWASVGLPTVNAVQSQFGGAQDAFVMKFMP